MQDMLEIQSMKYMSKLDLIIIRKYVQIRLDYSQLKIEVPGVSVEKLLTIMYLHTIDTSDDEIKLDYF